VSLGTFDTCNPFLTIRLLVFYITAAYALLIYPSGSRPKGWLWEVATLREIALWCGRSALSEAMPKALRDYAYKAVMLPWRLAGPTTMRGRDA